MKHTQYLYQEIKQTLMEEILALPADTQIASRASLMERFGVTRTTVEHAIGELIAEGYLYALNGSGTFVSRNMPSRVNRSKSLGLLLHSITKDVYPGVLRGFEDVCSAGGYTAMICNTDNEPEKQTAALEKLMLTGVSGVAIVPTIMPANQSPFERMREMKIPFVFCNRIPAGILAPLITSNSFYGGYIATKHLLDCGYRRIAFFSQVNYSTAIERYQGYEAALSEYGLPADKSLFVCGVKDNDEEATSRLANGLVTREDRPEAVFCFNDRVTQTLYRACRQHNIVVGRDIAVIGYDNSEVCEYLDVKLSSIHFRPYEIGARAAETLINMLMGADIPPTYIDVLRPELILRESSPKKAEISVDRTQNREELLNYHE